MAVLASVIDIDAVDAFADCANDPPADVPFRMPHGPAHGRVVFGPGDVRRLCYACVVAATGSDRPANPPRVGYINNCLDCDRDACRRHGWGDD